MFKGSAAEQKWGRSPIYLFLQQTHFQSLDTVLLQK
jgi:hypothetical protein